MKTLILSESQKRAAIVSGLSIIIMTIAAVFATDITINRLIVEDDSAETIRNILSSKTTYNIGVLSWIIVLICDLFAAWGLYLLFKKVSRNLSLITAWFRLSYVAMLAVSILNLVYVHIMVNQVETSSVGLSEQMSTAMIFHLDAFDAMWSLSLIVFGIHVLLLGYLALKSGYIPKILGILLIAAFVGYTIPKISNLLFPRFEDSMKIVEAIFFIPMLSEVALGIWLLVKSLSKR